MNAFRGQSWRGCLEMQACKNTEFRLSEVGTTVPSPDDGMQGGSWPVLCVGHGSTMTFFFAMLSITCLR